MNFLLPASVVNKVHSLKNLEESGISLDYLFNAFDEEHTDDKLLSNKVFKNKYTLEHERVLQMSNNDLDQSMPEEKRSENILSKNRVFPFVGVFPPTNRLLYKFLFNQLRSRKNVFKAKSRVLDVGCGTGVLGVIFKLAVESSKFKLFSVDKSEVAIKCSKVNHNLFNIPSEYEQVDITSLSESPRFFEKEQSFDFIICNPPWIIAKPIEDFDTGNYDPNEKFLTALFKVVKQRLSRNGGVFWLIYSDLSELLGLQTKDRIVTLSNEHSLVLRNQYSTKAEDLSKRVKTNIDVIKQQSRYIIFEITL